MAELKFCLKALVASLLIVLALQIHVGNLTLEQHTQTWLVTSPMPRYLDKVAAGAALAIRNASKSITQMTNQAMGNGGDSQRASRIGIDIQRSPSALKNQKSAAGNQQQQDD